MSEEIDVIDNVPDNQPTENEVKARRLGWVPKDEWKGPENRWRDADEFLERGEEIQGYLKGNLDRLQTQLSERDREIAEIKAAMEDFRKHHNETEARAYRRAIEELKALKAEAIENRDGAKVIELDDQIEQLREAQKKPAEPPVQKADQQVSQEYLEWLPQNTWYIQDKELGLLAEHLGNVIKSENPGLVGKPFLDEVTKRVKDMRPEKFDNPNRTHAAVATGSDGARPATSKKKKTYNDLPPDAKQACDRFVKQGWMTQEQYLKEYEWE